MISSDPQAEAAHSRIYTEQMTSSPHTRRSLAPVEVIAFVFELLAFAILALWGAVSWPFPWNIAVAVVAPALAIVVWALFVSPRSVFAVHPFVRAVIELSVYASATMALWNLGLAWGGLVYGIGAIAAGVLAGRRQFA